MLFSRASLLFSVALTFSATFALPVTLSSNGLASRSVENVIVSRQTTDPSNDNDCDGNSDPSCALNKCIQQCNFGGSGFSIEACTKACNGDTNVIGVATGDTDGTTNTTTGDSDTNATTNTTSGSSGSSPTDCDANINLPACATQLCVNNCLAGKTGENAQQCAISCAFTGPGNSTVTDTSGSTDATSDPDGSTNATTVPDGSTNVTSDTDSTTNPTGDSDTDNTTNTTSDSDTDNATNTTSGSSGSSPTDCDANINLPACATQLCVKNCLAGKSGENAQACAISCQFHD